jgi:hypothetical protein
MAPKAAKMPSKPDPTDDEDDDAAGADEGGDQGGDEAMDGADGADKPTVLCTVMDNHDGTYTLYHGDEPEEGEGDGEADEGDEGDEGEHETETMGAGAEGSDGGTNYDSIGALLKGIMDYVKESQSEGSDQENFDSGFGDTTGAAAGGMGGGTAMAGQKY